LKTNDIVVPRISYEVEKKRGHLDVAITKQKPWVDHALSLLAKEDLISDDKIVWGAYHTLHQLPVENPPSVCALLSLFY